MTASSDRAYFHRRAEQARRLAAAAVSPSVQRLHLEFVDLYAELAGEPDIGARRPILRVKF